MNASEIRHALGCAILTQYDLTLFERLDDCQVMEFEDVARKAMRMTNAYKRAEFKGDWLRQHEEKSRRIMTEFRHKFYSMNNVL